MTFYKQRDFWFQFLVDVLLVLFLIAVALIFKNFAGSIIQDALPGLSPVNPYFEDITADQLENMLNVAKLQYTIIFMMIVMVLVMFFGYVFSRALIYTRLLKRKLTGILFWKYCLIQLIWIPILLVLIYVLQFVFYLPLIKFIEIAAWAKFGFWISTLLQIIILANFTIGFFLSFAREEKIGKAFVRYYDNNIKGIRKYLKPMLRSWIVLLVLNFILFFITFFRMAFIFFTTLVMIGFAAWLRIYYVELSAASSAGALKTGAKKPIFKNKKVKSNKSKGKKSSRLKKRRS